MSGSWYRIGRDQSTCRSPFLSQRQISEDGRSGHGYRSGERAGRLEAGHDERSKSSGKKRRCRGPDRSPQQKQSGKERKPESRHPYEDVLVRQREHRVGHDYQTQNDHSAQKSVGDIARPQTHRRWNALHFPEERDRALVTIAGVIPDVDGLGIVADVLTRNSNHPVELWGKFHHVLAHNLGFALLEHFSR
jgi:hypothetical protein